jgi:hypothetical protein
MAEQDLGEPVLPTKRMRNPSLKREHRGRRLIERAFMLGRLRAACVGEDPDSSLASNPTTLDLEDENPLPRYQQKIDLGSPLRRVNG